jgi:nucleoside-diphosphate-sugar epimerase
VRPRPAKSLYTTLIIWRPFLQVHDAARAFVLALGSNHEVVSQPIFNVDDCRLNLRLATVSMMIANMLNSLTIEQMDSLDKRSYRASFDRIRTHLNFACDKTLEYGIREILYAISL